MEQTYTLGYAEWLATEIFKSHEDVMREAYINVRKNRLGSMMPMEFLMEEMRNYNESFVNAYVELMHIVSDDIYIQVGIYLEKLITSLMEEVEGMV